jgi:hypothetical protein
LKVLPVWGVELVSLCLFWYLVVSFLKLKLESKQEIARMILPLVGQIKAGSLE